MIYTNNYRDEELSKSFLSYHGKKYRFLVFSILAVLISFVLTLLFFSFDGTIVNEVFPTITGANSKSLFAVLFMLLPIVFIMIISILFTNYRTMTFAEITTNRMYMLIKMGEDINKVVLLRLLTALLLPIVLYSTSFVLALFVSIIFSYTINVLVMPGLYLSGLIILELATSVLLLLSLFIKKVKYAVFIYCGLFVLFALGVYFSNFGNVIQLSINVSSIGVIFGKATNYFLFICLGLTLVILLIILLRSLNLVKFYSTKKIDLKGIVVLDYNKNIPIKVKADNSKRKEKAFNGVIYSLFGLLVGISFFTNMFLIYMSTNNLKTQTIYNNIIPVVVGSATLKQGELEINPGVDRPQFIEENDLAFFESTADQNKVIEVGNIIYYIDSNTGEAVIEKVKFIDGNNYSIDVTYYPNEDDQGTLATTITRTQIKGVLVYVNRPLGSWIAINSSAIGKVVFLVVPLIAIVFYDRFRKLFKAYFYIQDNEEHERIVRVKK